MSEPPGLTNTDWKSAKSSLIEAVAENRTDSQKQRRLVQREKDERGACTASKLMASFSNNGEDPLL